MTGAGEKSYTFPAEQAGLYRIVCEAGNSTVQVTSCNLPVGLYSERAPFHLLGAAGDVYFCVPAGAQEFGVRVSSGGEGESVKAAVYDATGRQIGEKDNIDGHQFLFHRPPTADTEIWRLQLVKPSQGVLEDYYVQLQGIPPILATRPEALPRPALAPSRTSGPLPRLQVSENRRFLVTEDGRPFFWLGDTAWFLLRLTDDEIRYYLSNRVQKGFTGIQVELNPYAWTNLVPAGETENPFLDDNPDTPNETYWQRVDWMVDEVGRSGLYVLLTPMWGKYYPRYVGNDTNKARRLGRWLGHRYRDPTHILWFVSGEYDSINGYRAITPGQKAIFNAVAQGLEEGHRGAQLMTIHPGARRTSAADFHNEAWLDFNMLQSGHFDDARAAGQPENHTLIAHDYDRTPTKPVFDGEPAYEDMIDGYFRSPKDGSGSRMQADVMRREALEAPGAGQMRHLRALLESRPFLNRVPDQSLLASAEGSGKDHIRATRASDGRYALVYLPTGGATIIDMSRIAGAKAKASWFDPRAGKTAKIGEFPASGTRAFMPPSSGEGNDWVLVLDAADPESGSAEPTIPLGAEAADKVDYFPPPDAQGGWRTLKDAEEIRRVAGMDVGKLDEAFEVAAASTKNGGVLVVRHGWLVYEKYFGRGQREATPNLASCGKSFTSIAIGILMAERPELFPEGLDQRVFTPKYLPPEAFPLSDPAMAEIKLGQLLAFSAGIRGNNPCVVNGKEVTIDPPGPDGWPSIVDAIALGKRDHVANGQRYSAATLWCPPGGGYSYATASIHIASMIVRHVAGVELQEYLQKRVAEPLGWGRWGYGYRYAQEVTHTPGGGGITLRATDMLRFGYLLLHEGRWGDRQLVPAAYVRHCARQSPYNPHYAYSLQFNVNTDGHYPEYPRDAFWKSGSGAHMLYVVPALDLVVWKLAGRDGQYEPRDTGVPLAPEIAPGSESRRNWKPTIDERRGQRLVLSKVIEAITDSPRPRVP